MNKICTSQEQSKKLIELGIDINTADMYYDVNINSSGILSTPIVAVGKVWHTDIPAWSLSALMNLLGRGALFKTPQGCVCQAYAGPKAIISNYHSNSVDAAFEMVCWLKENGKI